MSRLTPEAGPVAVLVNPTAGHGKAGSYAVPVSERLSDAGFEVQLLIGEDGADAQRLAKDAVAAGVQALVAVGGDGVFHMGFNAVGGTTTPLGLVAAGAGNDFARNVGLPVRDPLAAADILLGCEPIDVDLGRLGDRWFGCVLSAGFDSIVNERANRMRWPRGDRRYDIAMLRELSVFKPLAFRMVLDGTPVESEVMLVAVGNAASYGGGMRICPAARLDDGRFHVTVVGPVTKLELLRVFPRVYKGTHVDHPAIRVYTAGEVTLESPGVVAYADGERIAPLPITARSVPAGLRLLAPPLA